jgi:hypothetical protein
MASSKTKPVFCPRHGTQYRGGPLRLLIQHRAPTFWWPYSVKDFALDEGIGNGAIMPGVSGIVGIVTLQPHMTLWYLAQVHNKNQNTKTTMAETMS